MGISIPLTTKMFFNKCLARISQTRKKICGNSTLFPAWPEITSLPCWRTSPLKPLRVSDISRMWSWIRKAVLYQLMTRCIYFLQRNLFLNLAQMKQLCSPCLIRCLANSFVMMGSGQPPNPHQITPKCRHLLNWEQRYSCGQWEALALLLSWSIKLKRLLLSSTNLLRPPSKSRQSIWVLPVQL